MAQLIVRQLDEDLVKRLKERAAARGHSAEEEHRQILRRALRSEGFVDHLLSIPQVGEDGDFDRPRDMPRSVDL